MNRMGSKMPTRQRQSGFTLIEMMIVVAVLGIIMAIAVPAYNDQTRRARRGLAKTQLTGMAQQLERFHTSNATYDGFSTATANSPATGTPAYTIVPSGLTATTFTLTATAVNSQVADTVCGNMVLTQTGDPTFSGTGGRADCWTR